MRRTLNTLQRQATLVKNPHHLYAQVAKVENLEEGTHCGHSNRQANHNNPKGDLWWAAAQKLRHEGSVFIRHSLVRRCVENQIGRHVLVFACLGTDAAKLDDRQIAIGNNVISTPVARVVARREIL